jgi:hypothetical protein
VVLPLPFRSECPLASGGRAFATADFAFEGVPAVEGVSLGEWDIVHWCEIGSTLTMVASTDAACEGRLFSYLSVEVHSNLGAGRAVLSITRGDGELIDRITFDVVE